MARSVLILLVLLLFVAGMGLVAYSLFSYVRVIPKLSNTTSIMDEYGTDRLATIQEVYWYQPFNATDNCNKTDEIIIMEISYDAGRIPDLCEILVDGRLKKRVRMHEHDCVVDCDLFDMAIDVPAHNQHIRHKIEICCQGMCSTEDLAARCQST